MVSYKALNTSKEIADWHHGNKVWTSLWLYEPHVDRHPIHHGGNRAQRIQ